MTRSHQLALTLSLLTAAPLLAADLPASAPAPTTQRSPQAIINDFKAAQAAYHAALPAPPKIADAKFRADNAANILPPLHKFTAVMYELAGRISGEQHDQLLQGRLQILGLGVALGDKDSAQSLTEASADKDPEIALAAKSDLALGHWIANSTDPKAQQKILDDYTPIAKANPENPAVVETLSMMTKLGPANDDLSKKAVDIIRTNLKGLAAEETLKQIDTETAQKALVGKPLPIVGRTTTNDKFDSASLKGKVVMLDFWATWCVPCRAELPNVKAMYKAYHDKGLEIVGIDCDGDDAIVNAFTKENDMPWPQLRELSQAGEDNWHPFAKKIGTDITGIPAMYLLDKSGTLRYIDAREDTEEKIQKLLAEPAPAAPAK